MVRPLGIRIAFEGLASRVEPQRSCPGVCRARQEEEMDQREHGAGEQRERRVAPRRLGAGRRIVADRRLSQLPAEEQERIRSLLKSCGLTVPSSFFNREATEDRRRSTDRRFRGNRRTGRDRRAA